mmetsp:Transcript_11839/g.31935  ORF Transcript_11839/g.31935 Transcript_11839/m.31935 type:complete len:782 (-) Transcript_11839:162-2507(-)
MGCNGSKPTDGGNAAPAIRGATSADQPEKNVTDKHQLLSEYKLGEGIGQGAFGVVYACAKKDSKDYDYAVKMVDKVETPVADIKKEAAMLKELEHPNVVKIYDVFYEKCFVCIVMARYNGGDLIECMQLHWKTKGKIPPYKVVHIARQMTLALDHLHSHLVVHRDIKGDNYLTDRKNICDPGCVVTLSDFGTAYKVKSENERLKMHCGTKIYWPPEFYSMSYGLKVDMWALGVIMYGLVDGRFPFKNEADVKTKHPKLPSFCPTKCREFTMGLIEKDESRRFAASAALKHAWVQEQTGGDEPASGAAEKFEAEGLREGGANALQDERRKELIERLEKKHEKKDDSRGRQQLAIMMHPKRFEVLDRHTGKAVRYEWWTLEKINQEIQDLSAVSQVLSTEGEVGKVDVGTVEKMLKEHNIDTSRFGVGETKTIEEFAEELHTGAALLMNDAAQGKTLVRVVDVVLVRIAYIEGGVKRYLTEFSEKFADGRDRHDLNRLPGTKKDPHENTKATSTRILEDILGFDVGNVTFDIDNRETFEEQEDSRSYPGVMTVYRKEIVECVVATTDDSFLTKLGLNGTLEYTHMNKDNNTKVYKWLTMQECANKSIKMSAPTENEEVSGLVNAAIGYSEEQLTAYLKEHGVDPTAFGQGHAKTLKEFSDELMTGGSTLMTQPDGKLIRVVDVVAVLINKHGTQEYLVEAAEKFKDGSTNQLKRLPGKKRRPDENQFLAVQRVLRRQLKMDENFVTLDAKNVRFVEEEKTSVAFPGVLTLYRKRILYATLGQS